MRHQGGPSITAPLSRTKRNHHHGKSFPIGLICAVLSAIFAFGGTLILAMAVISADNHGNANPTQGKEGALRSSSQSIVSNNDDHPPMAKAQGLLIHTHMGDIRIHFTPELAGESSIQYITDVVQSASAKQNNGMGSNAAETMNGRRITEGFMCQKCKFYRAEKQLLLQGIISEGPRNKVVLGPCPNPDYKPKSKCPSHDPNCGCHGPIMTKGMVGWAGGGGGPDFFINTFAKPVDWWENQHTVWGEIRDENSLKVVESVYELPAHMTGMRMLDHEIEFSLELF